MTDRYPFDRAVTRQPGTVFGTLGVGPDTVVVPETRTYHSADKTVSRRYREGDIVPAQEAILLGIVPTVEGEPVPAAELSVEEAISFLRGRGYQVSPMAVAGPMDAPIPDEALIAHVQQEGFEVEKPGDALPELEEPVIATESVDPFLVSGLTPEEEELKRKDALRIAEEEAAAKAEKPTRNKREADPSNKADVAPETKS